MTVAEKELRHLESKYTQRLPWGDKDGYGKAYFIEGPYNGITVERVKTILEKKYESENSAKVEKS